MKTVRQEILDTINDLAALREILSVMKKSEGRLREKLLKYFKAGDNTIEGEGGKVILKEQKRMVLDQAKIMKALGVTDLNAYKVAKTHTTMHILEADAEHDQATQDLIDLYNEVA